MARLLPREGKFFDFFNEHAELAILAAAELKALVDDIGDLELRRRNIERYEKQADHITHPWVLTIPCSAFVAAVAWWLCQWIG
jgi:uncharacterized protein